ncbi:MAG TPA: Sir2 family NAD-dependent protein deacetylase [Chitinophagaceae bacterium]|nr:Sir2 family NAD-dependent protein deacetylase [Chitinophagaceae bacterium]HNF46481.1 Sir2 family NAD-dependent protein deacetylase [Chitinophagaceae bacterium]HNJ25952.1 Sir2 family NAD-dependent protein deacetylase [Chitinophagaceae bacterium]HNJ56543.1 Sir2 family NAD-dependent protein deacetylase [Chitinophagaceae bacterium]HNL60629.1 Sir2 family NAD-dependent protein deacetylase [Chitinophagaceae bacterium]
MHQQTKKKLVVLTGAGISAESGIRTFRDSGGLWEGYDVNDVATPEAWIKNPELVLRFYNERRKNVAAAVPNAAHIGLAALEKYFDVTIITQNVDDLHERAGSTNIIHLHGEIFKMRSEYDASIIKEIKDDIQVGDRAADGHQFRPHIVWFGEEVPMMETATKVAYHAEIFVVVGTSLVVYPAAGLINYVAMDVPKYVIDKSIPSLSAMKNLTLIEKPATEGVAELSELLLMMA